jgi:hypothetical protein
MRALDEPGGEHERTRLFRRARVAVVALVIGYFFLPYGVQAWIPVWVPFLAALGLEVQFFLGGYLAGQREHAHDAAVPDRGPQERDLDELGWQPEPEEDEEEGDQEEEYEPLDYDERRPYTRHLAEAVVALAIVGGILFYAVKPHGWNAVSKANRARAEAVFSREATSIAGHPAAAVCDTSYKYVGIAQDADGAAQVGGHVAYILPSLCDELYQLKFKHRVDGAQTGRAIAVLTHESWHLHGVSDEGLTNCYAFQSGVGVGVDLGLSESKARALMREQLANNASDSAGDTRYLVPPGCNNGGEYDLHPGSDQFP